MSKKHFKVLIILLLIIEFTFVFLSVKSFSNKDINEVKEISKVDKEKFAMYKENSLGGYDEITDGVFPSGYALNMDKSNCIDSNGNIINNILSWNNNKLTITSNKTAYCYLYFDYPEIAEGTIGYSVYNTDNTNINYEGGLYRYQGTSDEVTNNYICFGTADTSKCTSDTDKYMYRIIGITADGQLKLIKKEALNTSYYWHNTYTTDTSWSESDLYKGLNGISGGTYSNLFINNSNYKYMEVDSEWYNKISDTSWKYGDVTIDVTDTSITAEYIYTTENNFTNTTTAKIGLWYLHDYYYGISGGNNCSSYSDEYETCYSSWIYLTHNDSVSDTYEWTMSRYGLYNNYYMSWVIGYGGIVDTPMLYMPWLVRPVMYVKASEVLKDGSGTSSDPFIII